MIDAFTTDTDRELTPFEKARLNVEMLATNMAVCHGFQQAIADLQECEIQLQTMEDPELVEIVRAEKESAEGRILAAHKITRALDIFCA